MAPPRRLIPVLLLVLVAVTAARASATPVREAANLVATPSYTLTDLVPNAAYAAATGVNARGDVIGLFLAPEDPPGAFRGFLWSQDGGLTYLDAPAGYSSLFPTDVNDRGDVAATAYTSGGQAQAFVYAHGVAAPLPGLDSTGGISNAGAVAGSKTISGSVHAAVYQHGTVTDIGSLGGVFAAGRDVNEQGVVAGTVFLPGDANRAFVYEKGEVTQLGTLGGSNSAAIAINASGAIVGYADTPSATHAFLYRDGVMSDLGLLPGTTSSGAFGINDRGDVVGNSGPFFYPSGRVTSAATLWRNGEIFDLNGLIPSGSGVTLASGGGINNRGDIVATGFAPSGAQHAYLVQQMN
jgi:probable HAF family extracellular repeat protein